MLVNINITSPTAKRREVNQVMENIMLFAIWNLLIVANYRDQTNSQQCVLEILCGALSLRSYSNQIDLF